LRTRYWTGDVHPAGSLGGDLPQARKERSRISRGSTRILHGPARLTRAGRQRRLKIQASWPWDDGIVTAWQRISALQQTPLSAELEY